MCRLLRNVVVVLLALSSSAWATSIVDQAYTPSLSEHGTVEGSAWFAQTFTVGIDGLMTGIDLSIGRENDPLAMDDLLISILLTTSGAPDSNADALASATLSSAYWPTKNTPDVDSYRHVEFTPFAVSSSDRLAISVRHAGAASGDFFYWYGGVSGYGGGDPFSWDGQAWSRLTHDEFDFAFRTYVADAAHSVPENTSTGQLMILSITAISLSKARFVSSVR